MNSKKVRGIVLCACIVGVLGVLHFFQDSARFQRKLESAIATSAEIHIKENTPFAWDVMYVIPPYTSEKSIRQALNMDTWPGDGPMYDEQQLFVFIKDGRIVAKIAFPRYAPGGDFVPSSSAIGAYASDDATFTNKNGILSKKIQ